MSPSEAKAAADLNNARMLRGMDLLKVTSEQLRIALGDFFPSINVPDYSREELIERVHRIIWRKCYDLPVDAWYGRREG